MKDKVKIEVLKEIEIKGKIVKKSLYYTGTIEDYNKDNIIIKTTRGETYIFRKDQIQGRRVIRRDEDDKNKKKP